MHHDDPPPAWDTRVLHHPQILDVPDRLGQNPDPRVALAVVAVERQTAGDANAPKLLARLAHAGVVALRTGDGAFELRETADGWLLVGHPGDPDPAELAAAAEVRARRLARTRRRPDPDTP
jgi:hypothetical protein